MTKIALYNSKNIDSFIWSDNQLYEKRYLLPLIKEGSQKYFANVKTEVALLEVGDQIFPLTINSYEYENSYVCSPFTALFCYSKEEMKKLKNKPLEFVLRMLVNIVGIFLKSAKINKVVSINNWLLSTNLYRDWDGEEIKAMTDFLKEEFPDHVLMSRSLNTHTNSVLLRQFTQNGYAALPSRQVYIFDQAKADYSKKKNVKWDFALLEKTPYHIVNHEDIAPQDYSRITELYNKLYLDKYSYLNPQFTTECIAFWHQNRLLVMQGLRNEKGVLDGIAGCFERDGVTTAPLVGYDTALPQSLGLYRMLLALVIKRAYLNDFVLNCSSGASEFKRLRGAFPEIEYSAIYTKHLSLYRRLIWQILDLVLSKIGVPLMRKYKL